MSMPDAQDNVLPPADWEPKSAFFKSIWKQAQFNMTNRRWSLQCPCCGHWIDMVVQVQEVPRTKAS